MFFRQRQTAEVAENRKVKQIYLFYISVSAILVHSAVYLIIGGNIHYRTIKKFKGKL